MMDGRNSSGRKVSLLNDCRDVPVAPRHRSFQPAPAPASTQKLPSLSASLRTVSHSHSHSHSRSFSERSASSTPSLSPQTPPLTRSESSDSRAFASPSPLTPQSSSFDNPAALSGSQKQQQQQQQQQQHQAPQQLHHHQHHQQQQLHHQAQAAHQGYYLYRPNWNNGSNNNKMDDPTLFPAIPEGAQLTGLPLPPMVGQTPRVRSSDSPTSDSRVSSTSAPSAAKQTAKKSHYPCPLAKQFNCTDFFTTSGHAARHAKKHTGRKDAICPECNKAFTRKDNMEQHRRTHQNVRGPAKNTENRVKKPKSGRKTDKESGTSAATLQTAIAQLDDPTALTNDFNLVGQTIQPALLPGAGPYFMNTEPINALPQPMTTEYAGRPPLYRSSYTNSLDFAPPIPGALTDPNVDLHFNYPSPGLSNGLNTLALAASGHKRVSSGDRRASDDGSNSGKSGSEDVTP